MRPGRVLALLAPREYPPPPPEPPTGHVAPVRAVAYDLKSGDRAAVAVAAAEMARFVPRGATLVPVPSSRGSTAANLRLAEAVAALSGAAVMDGLSREPSKGQYELRKAGARPLSADEMRVTWSGPRPSGAVFLVDNVSTSGATFEAAARAMGLDVVALAWADARGADAASRVRRNPGPAPVATYRHVYEAAHRRVVIAAVDGEEVGYLVWHPSTNPRVVHLDFVTVDEDRRRSGVGRGLVREFISRVRRTVPEAEWTLVDLTWRGILLLLDAELGPPWRMVDSVGSRGYTKWRTYSRREAMEALPEYAPESEDGTIDVDFGVAAFYPLRRAPAPPPNPNQLDLPTVHNPRGAPHLPPTPSPRPALVAFHNLKIAMSDRDRAECTAALMRQGARIGSKDPPWRAPQRLLSKYPWLAQSRLGVGAVGDTDVGAGDGRFVFFTVGRPQGMGSPVGFDLATLAAAGRVGWRGRDLIDAYCKATRAGVPVTRVAEAFTSWDPRVVRRACELQTRALYGRSAPERVRALADLRLLWRETLWKSRASVALRRDVARGGEEFELRLMEPYLDPVEVERGGAAPASHESCELVFEGAVRLDACRAWYDFREGAWRPPPRGDR